MEVLKALMVKDAPKSVSPKKDVKPKIDSNLRPTNQSAQGLTAKDFSKLYQLQEDPEFNAEFRESISRIIAKISDSPEDPESNILKLLELNDEKLKEDKENKVRITLNVILDQSYPKKLY